MKYRRNNIVGIWCVDQDRATTSSLGIFNYTRNLISHLARNPDPGFKITVWLTGANRKDMLPESLPQWMDFRIVSDKSCGTGWRRIWTDQLAAAILPAVSSMGAIHFPKGWIPFTGTFGTPAAATIHDNIILYYKEHYPLFFPPLQLRYFEHSLFNSLRKADQIIFPSSCSAEALSHFISETCPHISTIPTGAIEPLIHSNDQEPRSDLLVLSSLLPHKATVTTLRLLQFYGRSRNIKLNVSLAGLVPESGLAQIGSLDHLNIIRHGIPSDQSIINLLRRSRALVYLSEIEGFGIPILEAYSAGTPVCYRNTTAPSEMMNGAPGGWNGRTDEDFLRAMDEVLSMTPDRILGIRSALEDRFNWNIIVRETLKVYASLLEK